MKRLYFTGLFLATLSISLLLGVSGCHKIKYWAQATFRSESNSADVTGRARTKNTDFEVASLTSYWPGYRGPARDSQSGETDLNLDWAKSPPKVKWRIPVGAAYASIAVIGDHVFTMEQREEREALICVSAEDGKLIWEQTWPGRFYEMMSKEGPRTTPLIIQEQVICLGAEGALRSFNLNGKLLWQAETLEAQKNLTYGFAASPITDGTYVFIQNSRQIQAREIKTGKLIWTSLDEKMAYATPVLGKVLGEQTLLIATAESIVGLDPNHGKERFRFDWHVFSGLTCTQPVMIDQDKIVVSAGYGKGAQMFQLKKIDGKIQAERQWSIGRFKSRFNEPVLYEGHLYGLDEGILACLEPNTGKITRKKGRYGYGQLLMVEDHLILCDEKGAVHLLKISPDKFESKGQIQVLDSRFTLNLPALANGRLYLRNNQEMVAVDLR